MKSVLPLLITTLIACDSAIAATGDPLDLQIRYGHYYASLVINEDGTSVGSYEWSKRILKKAALEPSGRASVYYDTQAQKAEITAAYTLKADGRRIDAPRGNYQVEVGSFQGQATPAYAGLTTLTVAFPDVAVGDSVVLAYQLMETEPIFPKHYSASQYFYSQVAYDDVRVRFDYPAAMWVQYEARGMRETENSAKGDRKIVEWRYANPQPIKSDRRDFSVFDPDKEAGYAFSTFKSYAEVASAYGERALPKAQPSARITKLAAEIVAANAGDEKDAREQARALYEWVATNIRYAGNRTGTGSVVPRDVSFILDNKKGDCKDKATLLQALLAARGIKSFQALLNNGSGYRLPKIPVATTFDHALNYLPLFDLYVDSALGVTPFGKLPFEDQDKPVWLVEAYRDGMKTPVPVSGSNRQHTKSVIKIDPDGSASGSVEVLQNGLGAERSRAWARDIGEDEADTVRNMLGQQGMIGSGKFEKDDPSKLTDSYHYRASFKIEKFIGLPGAGSLNISLPLGLSTPIQSLLQAAMDAEPGVDTACSSMLADEDYVIEFPKTVKVLAIPADVKVANDFLAYTASYKLKDNILTVKRMLDDRTKGNVCSPEVGAEHRIIAGKAMLNLREQVRYQ